MSCFFLSNPILPGFSIPLGSRAFFIDLITSSAGPNCFSIYGALARPVPCSAVMVPPISRAISASSSAAGFSLSQSSWLLISVTKVVWTFPSPIWPKVVRSKLYLSAIACAFLIVSGIFVGGIPRSSDMGTSLLPGLILESVGTSFPRASIISPALAGSSLQVNSSTLYFLHTSLILSISLITVSLTPSDSIINMASILLTSLSI
ncbi:hypothetical protein ES703_83945 [subsurface metagenome]